jgi:hypothetical protein
MAQRASAEKKGSKPRDLHMIWRVALVLAGAMLCLLALALFGNPPTWESRRAIGTASESVDQVRSDPTTFCVALLGAGVLMLLVAANGRKLLEVGSSGAKFDGPSDEQVSEDAAHSEQVKAKDEVHEPVVAATPERTFVRDGFEFQVFDPESIPASILADVVNAKPEAVKTISDIAYAFRKTGKGNHAWFIKTHGGATLQVSYGGQGKTEPTVKTG